MSVTLAFPDATSLYTALRTGLIPEDVQSQPMFWSETQGKITIKTQHLDACFLGELAELGVKPCEGDPQVEGVSWSQPLPLLPSPSRTGGWFLLTTSSRSDLLKVTRQFIQLENHLLSLNFGDLNRIQVHNPALFLLAKLSEDPNWLIHEQRSDGHWQSWGFRHLCEEICSPNGTKWMFSHPCEWAPLPSQGWTALETIMSIELAAVEDVSPATEPEKIPIVLKLIRDRSLSEARFWLIETALRPQFERWVASLSSTQRQGLSFTVLTTANAQQIILRSDHLIEAPAGAKPFKAIEEHSSVFIPLDTKLSPPLPLKYLLGPLEVEAGQIIWLEQGQDKVRIKRLKEHDFYSLNDWVHYVLDEQTIPVKAWIKGIGPLFKPTREHDPIPNSPSDRAQELKPTESEPIVESTGEKPYPSYPPTGPISLGPAIELTTVGPGDSEKRQALETQLRSAPQNIELWTTLAKLEDSTGRSGPTIQALGRAWWTLSPEQRRAEAGAWLAKVTSNKLTNTWCRILAGNSNEQDSDFILNHQSSLDIRAIWLCQQSLVQAKVSDNLALLQTKDYLLNRIRNDLKPGLDIPNFLVHPERSASERRKRSASLEQLYHYLRDTHRPPHPAEERPENTTLLIRAVIGVGYAILGETESARKQIAEVGSRSQQSLIAAIICLYSARIEHAEKPSIDLTEVKDLRNSLSGLEGYLFDQLLQSSPLLNVIHGHSALEEWKERQGLASQLSPKDLELDELLSLTPRLGLDRLEKLISTLDDQGSLSTHWRAYSLALAWERPHLAKQIESKLLTGIEDHSNPQAITTLVSALPQLIHFGSSRANIQLLKRIQPLLNEPHLKLSLEAAIAGLNETNQAVEMASDAIQQLSQTKAVPQRLENIRAICQVLQTTDVDTLLPLVATLSSQWVLMQDNRPTNKYFSAAALSFTEYLVLAVTGSYNQGDRRLLSSEAATLRSQINDDTRTLQ